jgi:hypothetical protein
MDLLDCQGKQLVATAGRPALPSRPAGGGAEAERAAAALADRR